MSRKWVLEGYFGSHNSTLQRISLKKFPVTVGRDPKLELSIVRNEVSRHHAELFEGGDGNLYLRDLDSTNGTFVNHQQLKGETIVRHGDVVHFASYEVRVIEENETTNMNVTGSMTVLNIQPLSNKLPTGLNELQVLLDERAIAAEFQPIVGIRGELYGYEILGRGSRPDLPRHPLDLFRIAESMTGKAADLSRIMRDCGVEQAIQQSPQGRLFMNTHPEEMKDIPVLLNSMRLLRETFPDLPMVLEIHEDAIADVGLMKQFANDLMAMDYELAYDDFGAGQARLMEMIDVPVKYVKFDIALIRGLHNAPESKQKMVAALAAMTKAMGIQALAEGVEYPEELALCEQMNFDLIQGYMFGKPSPQLTYQNPLS